MQNISFFRNNRKNELVIDKDCSHIPTALVCMYLAIRKSPSAIAQVVLSHDTPRDLHTTVQ